MTTENLSLTKTVQPNPSDIQPAQAQPQAPQNPAETENVLITGQILGFMCSEAGQDLTKQVVNFFKDWKNQAVKVETHSAIVRNTCQILTLALVLGVAVYVSSSGKMDPVIAGLLGTLAGYALGQKASK